MQREAYSTLNLTKMGCRHFVPGGNLFFSFFENKNSITIVQEVSATYGLKWPYLPLGGQNEGPLETPEYPKNVQFTPKMTTTHGFHNPTSQWHQLTMSVSFDLSHKVSLSVNC